MKYISNYYREDIGDGVIVISTDNLKKYDLITDTDLTETNNNDSCKGYALVRNKDNMVTSDAYINCKNYASEGYQAWRLVDNKKKKKSFSNLGNSCSTIICFFNYYGIYV